MLAALPAVLLPVSSVPALKALPVVVTAAVAAAAACWPRSGRPPLAGPAALAAVLSLLLDPLYPGPISAAGLWGLIEATALTVLVGRAVRIPDARTAAAVTALTGTALVLLPLRLSLHQPGKQLADHLVGAAMGLLVAVVAGGIGLYLRTLDTRRVRAIAEAQREQRLSVARDLHDFVAHEVTGIVLEAQGGQLGETDPAEAKALLARIEAAGLRALDSMDRTVSTLRDPDGTGAAPDRAPSPRRHGLAELAEVVERFGPTARLEAGADSGPDAAAAPEVEEAVHRLVVEALTNVRRHAGTGAAVTVRVERDGERLRVSVHDDGGGAASGPAPRLRRRHRGAGGLGLAELTARVEALGGTLSAAPAAPGWTTTAVLPLDPGR
ncbi:hypothetical protein BIV57_19940 [Mangrovactinospora gilvigrisea]|uniref:histidine kinase n=1 Tax=Mangrovactinospora gilvigrisea TaxID=1428644 RepID=A0A1J7BAP3_9ACTN|nr:hypothetical protein BIV57_19940 [Mangrovactinospora gilvigrisea]